MSKLDKRTQLLRVGVAAFTERGFFNTSVSDIVAAAGVPKGSFAYYFESKDKYVLDVIRTYAEYFNNKLDKILLDQRFAPIRRIQNFIDEAIDGMARYGFRRGCLVGNLGQELAALNDESRELLLHTLGQWQARLASCLKEAQSRGELHAEADTQALARFFWYAWEGAVLCSKLEQSAQPLQVTGQEFMQRLARGVCSASGSGEL